GRDRIHALGLHIVMVIHDMDVRAAYEHAPDFASRINELLEFDSEAFGPPRTGLLSPLGPVRHPDPRGPIASDLSEELRGIGHRVRLSEHTHWRAAAAAGWSLAEHTHTRVAWIECGRWDFERTLAWLTELGSMRAWIMFGADNDFLATVAAPSSILSSAV